jgi:hypothetical protein
VQGERIQQRSPRVTDASSQSSMSTFSSPGCSPAESELQGRVHQSVALRLESDIAALKAHAMSIGAASRMLVLRWWELGVLAMQMGWRTKDQMQSVRHATLLGNGMSAHVHTSSQSLLMLSSAPSACAVCEATSALI